MADETENMQLDELDYECDMDGEGDFSEGEMSEEERARDAQRVRELERLLRIDEENRLRWPLLTAEKEAKESREAGDENEGNVQDAPSTSSLNQPLPEEALKRAEQEAIDKHIAQQLQDEEVRKEKQAQRKADREARRQKEQELEEREQAVRRKEEQLNAEMRRVEELRKAIDTEKVRRDKLQQNQAQKTFLNEASSVQASVDSFASEVRLRLEALRSMCNQGAGVAAVPAKAPATATAPEVPPTNPATPGCSFWSDQANAGDSACPARGHPRENTSSLKIGSLRWKEGDDYRIWRRILCLELAKLDCLFLIDPAVKPHRRYNRAELDSMKSSVMAYLLSNFPEKYQHMLDEIKTPRDMMEVLDNAIIPPSPFVDEDLQAQLSNLYHDPNRETVIEFRSRVQKLVNAIRQNPEAELTEGQIRRNVLGAIAGAYPELHSKAIRKRAMSLTQIYDRMSLKKITQKDVVRRATEAGMAANTSKRTAQKRKAPAPLRDSTVRKPQRNDRCFKCGFTGHWAAKCRNPEIGCYNCREFGHIARECKQPLTERSREILERKNNPAKRARRGNKTPAQDRLEKKQKERKNNRQDNRRGNRKDKRVKSAVKKVKPENKKEAGAAIAVLNRARGSGRRQSTSSTSSYASFTSCEGKIGQLNMIADSGACEHMVNDASVFSELRTMSVPMTIICANKDSNAALEVNQIGDIVVFNSETGKKALLRNVLYAPGLVQNLFSIRKQIDKGLVARFTIDRLEIIDSKTDEVLKRGQFINKFWWVSFELPLLNESQEKIDRNLYKMRKYLNLAIDESQTSPPENSKLSPNIESNGEEPQGRKQNRKRKGGHISESSLKRNRKRSKLEKGNVDLKTVVSEQVRQLQSNDVLRAKGLKWHYRMNHASRKYLELASKIMPELLGVQFGSEIMDCSFCKMAKGKRKPCTQKRRRSDQPFHRLYSDLVGPLKPGAFRTNARYFVTFTDDATRYAFAYEIIDKTQVNRAFMSCLEDIRKITGPATKISELRIDGGLEYQTLEMKELLAREGVAVTVCEPYTPQHNGTAERLNLEIEEKIRVNLLASGLPTYLWPFTLSHVLHVHNRTPNASNEFKSPYEVLKGEVPSITHLRRYGCEAYVLDKKAKQKSKFEPRANLHFLVACGDTGYTLFNPIHRTVTRSKDVEFIESRTYTEYKNNSVRRVEEAFEEIELEEDIESKADENIEEKVDRNTEENRPIDNLESEIEQGKQTAKPSSSKPIGESGKYEFFEEEEVEEAQLLCLLQAELDSSEQEPATYKEALNSPQAMHWKKAIHQEFAALEGCQTWKIVPRAKVPKGTKVMSTRWVHKRKHEANGEIRFRSRLVARGFADTNSYELAEIYAPVARLPDVRFILIVAAKYGLKLTQLDVKTAFLNGTLEKLVYINFPDGYREYLGDKYRTRKDSVCEVHKALYGLKVSPRRWFERFLEAVEKLDFIAYKFQACLFIWREGNKIAIMLLYVDDILLASNCPKKTAEVKSLLRKEFSITDLGTPRKFLGMEIEIDKQGSIRLHQKQHIETLLKKFKVDSKKYNIPMLPDFGDGHKDLEQGKDWDREKIPYRQAIGTLLYIQNGTRPDISYAVNVLSRRQGDFTEKHWDAVQRVMGYLDETKDLALHFSPHSDTINCYVDASLGMNAENGHSTTGYIVYMFGCPVAWRTQKQKHVALSSAEAEFVAMSKACRELANLQVMCSEILQLQIIPVIHEDSKPAIRLAEVDDSSTLKHLVRLAYLYVREQHKKGMITIRWVGTESQIADLLTKPLSKGKYRKFREKMLCF